MFTLKRIIKYSTKFYSTTISVKFNLNNLLEEKIIEVEAEEGESIMEVGKRYNMKWGLCEGNIECGTCHCVLPKSIYDTIPPAGEAESDLLNLAVGRADTSRLGCQVKVDKSFEGITLRIPKGVRGK